jgi:hypothetical protein
MVRKIIQNKKIEKNIVPYEKNHKKFEKRNFL